MVEIRPIAGDDPRLRPLLEAHHAHSIAHSPPTSRHCVALDAMVAPDLHVWAALSGPEVLGVGALRAAPPEGEVKSMHTCASSRGLGVASEVLHAIEHAARSLGIKVLRLETGSMEAYAAARRLYARHGFVERGPFGAYRLDPLSTYYEKTLTMAEA